MTAPTAEPLAHPAHLQAIRAETSQQRADRLLAEDRQRRRTDNYSPLYGYPVGYRSNPVTGSCRAYYGNGLSFEIALPTCEGCDGLIDDHGYCPACEATSAAFGVVADWPAIGAAFRGVAL